MDATETGHAASAEACPTKAYSGLHVTFTYLFYNCDDESLIDRNPILREFQTYQDVEDVVLVPHRFGISMMTISDKSHFGYFVGGAPRR